MGPSGISLSIPFSHGIVFLFRQQKSNPPCGLLSLGGLLCLNTRRTLEMRCDIYTELRCLAHLNSLNLVYTNYWNMSIIVWMKSRSVKTKLLRSRSATDQTVEIGGGHMKGLFLALVSITFGAVIYFTLVTSLMDSIDSQIEEFMTTTINITDIN